MGKIDGFLEYERKVSAAVPPRERVENYNEFHRMLSQKEQQLQGARCMNCGVPFCQSGYLAQTPGLIIEKNGQPLAYEDLRPGDIVRTVYLNGDAAQLIAPATYHPIYIEVLN